MSWEFGIIIVIMVMVVKMKDSCECCLDSERNGLLQINSLLHLANYGDFPNNFSSPFYQSSRGWYGDDCCNWVGIGCDSTTHHVTEVYLNTDSSQGEWYLNASLFLPFQQLNQLYLSYSNISGCIHNEGFERLWKLTNLELLDLSYNSFNNSIIPSLRGFPSLKTLGLGGNKLHGTINISELNNLTTTLQELDLSWNEIEGFETMPAGAEEIPIFNNLEDLDLGGNYFNNLTTANVFQTIGRITSLKSLFLEGSGLSGKIPASRGLCNLKHLEDLDMSNNTLNGNLPWCLSNLTSLQTLDLSYNQFTGSISPMHGLTSLQELDISNNQFTGRISPMHGLTSLHVLVISNNHFRIPMSLSPLFNLSLLTTLHVTGNTVYADTEVHSLNPKFQLESLHMDNMENSYITKAIPKFLYHQSNLEYIDFSNTKLTGGFPYWLLENNTGLRALDLANTSLSGTLHLPTHPHVSLGYLDVSDNFFHGYIPSQIGVYFPTIEYLIMSRNELNGSLPGSLCNIASFVLEISHNNISGTLPQCIGNISFLGILNLSINNISGTLPNFSQPSIIFLLDLSYNSFSGSIPLEFGELLQLSFLVLGNNNLEGEIPIELCKLKLSVLDLSHNKFSGHMLPCLSITSSESKVHQNFSGTHLQITMKGHTYLYETEMLNYITGIDISCNNLTGKIPFKIQNLISIKALNLSCNCLTGPIPSTFSNLKEIESLDLSHNNLQGAIPHQLTQLTSLEVFDVSYNNLSGQTPGQVAQFLTFDESSYEGNPFLCGWPLPKICGTPDSSPESNATSSLHEDKSNNEFIDMEFFYVSFGVAYAMVLLTLVTILCINPYWRRVWFYYVQMSTEKTYYFIIDHVIPLFSRL